MLDSRNDIQYLDERVLKRDYCEMLKKKFYGLQTQRDRGTKEMGPPVGPEKDVT